MRVSFQEIAGIAAMLILSHGAAAQSTNNGSAMKQASGTFDIKLAPLASGGQPDPWARKTIDKQFQGGLVGHGAGEMMAAGQPAAGSAAYVALERVTGVLDGRKGSFVLMHAGTMKRGAAQLTVTVVPGSATDELAGLEGSMSIRVDQGRHVYSFDYVLAPAAGQGR